VISNNVSNRLSISSISRTEAINPISHSCQLFRHSISIIQSTKHKSLLNLINYNNNNNNNSLRRSSRVCTNHHSSVVLTSYDCSLKYKVPFYNLLILCRHKDYLNWTNSSPPLSSSPAYLERPVYLLHSRWKRMNPQVLNWQTVKACYPIARLVFTEITNSKGSVRSQEFYTINTLNNHRR